MSRRRQSVSTDIDERMRAVACAIPQIIISRGDKASSPSLWPQIAHALLSTTANISVISHRRVDAARRSICATVRVGGNQHFANDVAVNYYGSPLPRSAFSAAEYLAALMLCDQYDHGPENQTIVEAYLAAASPEQRVQIASTIETGRYIAAITGRSHVLHMPCHASQHPSLSNGCPDQPPSTPAFLAATANIQLPGVMLIDNFSDKEITIRPLKVILSPETGIARVNLIRRFQRDNPARAQPVIDTLADWLEPLA